jgi:tRNA (cmo5U34)-methyltransferase
VPYYNEGHDLILKLSDYFIQKGSLCYDLGCSTGTLLYQLAARHNVKPAIKWVGIDSQPEMVEEANKRSDQNLNIDFICDNIIAHSLQKADLIISFYTMQFIPPRNRQLMFDKIYAALNWGGAFILFEKVRGADARFQDIMTSLYTDFKLEQGYSSEEIIAKQKSLKGILEPFSTQGNIDLMKRAGFVDIMSVFKYVCFEGFLAIK